MNPRKGSGMKKQGYILIIAAAIGLVGCNNNDKPANDASSSSSEIEAGGTTNNQMIQIASKSADSEPEAFTDLSQLEAVINSLVGPTNGEPLDFNENAKLQDIFSDISGSWAK